MGGMGWGERGGRVEEGEVHGMGWDGERVGGEEGGRGGG